jgi:hypothetical protein
MGTKNVPKSARHNDGGQARHKNSGQTTPKAGKPWAEIGKTVV